MTWDIAASSDINLALPAVAPSPSALVAGGSAPAGGFASVLAGAAPAAPAPGTDRQALAIPGNFLPPLAGAGDAIVADNSGLDDAGDGTDDDAAAPDSGSADGSNLLAWWPGAVPPAPAPPPPADNIENADAVVAPSPSGNGGAKPLGAPDAADDTSGDSALALPLVAGGDTPTPGVPPFHAKGQDGPVPAPHAAGNDAGAATPNAGAAIVPPAPGSAGTAPVVLAGLLGGDTQKGAGMSDAPGALAKDVKPGAKATLALDDKALGNAQTKLAGQNAVVAPGDDKTAGPAGQVFAARIGAAMDAPAPRGAKRGAAAASVDPLNLLGAIQSGGGTPLTARPVMAAAAADLPVIQASDPEWIEKFVDQIDMLRGDNGTSETRIRLSPDALGTLDVRIAQRDGQTHVQINADQAGARALLADAAPRLADLAQARGLKLNTSFADGQGQPSQRQDQGTPTQRAPRMNDSAAPADMQTDERIG